MSDEVEITTEFLTEEQISAVVQATVETRGEPMTIAEVQQFVSYLDDQLRDRGLLDAVLEGVIAIVSFEDGEPRFRISPAGVKRVEEMGYSDVGLSASDYIDKVSGS